MEERALRGFPDQKNGSHLQDDGEQVRGYVPALWLIDARARRYAATFRKNPSTSLRRSPAAFSTASEAASTVCAEPRVSVAAPATSPSAITISLAPLAALVTFAVISP